MEMKSVRDLVMNAFEEGDMEGCVSLLVAAFEQQQERIDGVRERLARLERGGVE